MSGCLVFKQAFFSLLFLCSPVLQKKSKSRLQFSVGTKEGKRRPLPRSSLEVISDGFQMMVEGECAKKVESYSVIPEP